VGAAYDYFMAIDDGNAKALGRRLGGPVAAGHPGVVETTWVDPWVRVGQLYFHVLGQDWHYDESLATQVLPEVPIGPDNFEEPTLHRLSADVRDVLADVVADRRDVLGQWWSRTEEFLRDRADASYVERLCTDLLTLCRDARDTDRQVYVWGSL